MLCNTSNSPKLLILINIIVTYLLFTCNTLYNDEECIQKCPPFFEQYETPQVGEGQDLLQQFMDMTEMQEFEPRCIVNIANYAYLAGESLNDIDLKTYQESLDTVSPSSPHYCFKELKGLKFDDAKNNNLDPRWDGLKITDNLCDKYDTMRLCNIYWPCVANGIKSVCDNRGIYNCSSKSCHCFNGFTNTPIRSRPEDSYISCDIGIRALFNDTLPIIPDDFIIDGNFKEKIIEIDQYMLPTPVQLRFWSQAYLLDEFNRAINDVDGMFVDAKKRQTYLPFITNQEELINENSTLLIGVSMHYIDWDSAVDSRVEGISELQMRYIQETPLTAQTKTTRSNSPGWIAINGNGLYQIGDQYWLSDKTTELPPKAGIGYTTNIKIEWYSSKSLVKFSTIGKTEIEFEFAEKMEISSMRMTWRIKSIESNTTKTNMNEFHIMIDTAFTIKTNRWEVLLYFKTKHETDTELSPPKDISGTIKPILESRKITVINRKYGGMIIGQIRYPQIRASSSMNDKNITDAFKMGFQRALRINIKYIDTEIDTSGVSKMLNIIIFRDEDHFGSLYARLKDEEDPITGYLSDEKFSNVLEKEMKFVQHHLIISFDSWQVISNNDLFAAWYEISVFATLSEINSKTGITKSIAEQYLDGFKQSLFDGMSGLTIHTEVKPDDILRYFNIKGNIGHKYEAEIKVTADYVKKTQQIESNSIAVLTDISLNKGWGMVDTHKSTAVARISVFAGILIDENENNAVASSYLVGFPKGDTLIVILKELVTDSHHNVNIDILNSENTAKSNILKITIEFYVSIQQESYADNIIDIVKNPKFAKLINEKALERNFNIFATEITLIYPSKLNSNVDTLVEAKVELSESASSILNGSDNVNASIVTDSVLPRFVDRYWPIRLPVDIFCSEFYTNLQFGTSISFGFLKQYFCIQLVNMIPGEGKVLLKSKLIYKPKQPGAPDGLSSLCDYWAKIQTGDVERNPSLDEKLKNSGPGIDNTCSLLSVGKELIPDNLPNTMPNVAALLGGQIEIMDLPDIILNDPRPNQKFPKPDLLKTLGLKQQPLNQSNITNNQTMHESYETRTIYDKIPPDAFVVFAGIVVFVILKLIYRRQKRKRLRQKMLAGLAEDMEEMQNIAKSSKLTAEEYKAIYEQAKEKVDKLDFSKYEKRKKRKQKWADLEEKEKQQKKRERLKQIATEQHVNLISDEESGDTEQNQFVDKNTESDDFNKLFESETTAESYTNETTEESVTISD